MLMVFFGYSNRWQQQSTAIVTVIATATTTTTATAVDQWIEEDYNSDSSTSVDSFRLFLFISYIIVGLLVCLFNIRFCLSFSLLAHDVVLLALWLDRPILM